MMLTDTARYRAGKIADMVPVIAADRADNEWADDWAEHQTFVDYVTMLRSMQAWVTGPDWDPVVRVQPRMRPSSESWSYTAAGILDQASDRVDTAAGVRDDPREGTITSDPTTFEATLRWKHKPNLERVFHDAGDRLLGESIWRKSPMISVYFAGRRYLLGWDLQHLIVTVANRHGVRHTYGSEYGRALLILSRALRADTVTVQRLASIVVPCRCHVDHERNTALTILSAEQERAARAGVPVMLGQDGQCPVCLAEPDEPCDAECPVARSVVYGWSA